jgi:outer membrane protein OmpA-like peptidoglycan-associated protein
MKLNFLSAGLIYLAIICLLLIIGCNTFHTGYFGVEDEALTAPREFDQTRHAIEQAKETADSLYAEKKIDEAMDLGKEAAITYWACYDRIAKNILALSRQAAYEAELYHPQPPLPPMKREPAISSPLMSPETVEAGDPFAGLKALPPRMVLETFYFDFNSAILQPYAKPLLDRQTAFIKNHADFIFEIAGHTDSVGPDAYNQMLSRRRAKSVESYLTSKGVENRQLAIFGYGESQPIATNLTDEGQAKNRRSELRVMGSLLPGFALKNIASLPVGTTLEVINFNCNEHTLQPVYRALLDNTVSALKKNPRVKLEIAGHTDVSGSQRKNLALSFERANSVKNYLISKGISTSHMKTKIYAAADPLASNASSIGRALNRRVEIRIAP